MVKTATPAAVIARTSMFSIVCLFSLVLIAGSSPQKSFSARREQVPFSIAIGNGELMHECFPKYPRMGTARQKLDNEIEEEGKRRRINVERSTADTKERSLVQSPCRVVTSSTHDSPSPITPSSNINKQLDGSLASIGIALPKWFC